MVRHPTFVDLLSARRTCGTAWRVMSRAAIESFTCKLRMHSRKMTPVHLSHKNSQLYAGLAILPQVLFQSFVSVESALFRRGKPMPMDSPVEHEFSICSLRKVCQKKPPVHLFRKNMELAFAVPFATPDNVMVCVKTQRQPRRLHHCLIILMAISTVFLRRTNVMSS